MDIPHDLQTEAGFLSHTGKGINGYETEEKKKNKKEKKGVRTPSTENMRGCHDDVPKRNLSNSRTTANVRGQARPDHIGSERGHGSRSPAEAQPRVLFVHH